MLELRHVHVDGDPAVGQQPQLEPVVDGVHPQRGAIAQALVVHVTNEAARPVAAMLDLVAACAIEDAVAEVDPRQRARFDHQDLVGADAETPITEQAHLLGRQAERRSRGVQHDEIVAGTVHLGEADLHAALSAQQSFDALAVHGAATPSPLWEEGGGEGQRMATTVVRATSHPNPLPRGEGGINRGTPRRRAAS